MTKPISDERMAERARDVAKYGAYEDIDNLLTTLANRVDHLRTERDEAKAALARVTDDSMVERLIDALVMTRLSDHAGTDMRLISEAAGKVLAAIRAVAAVEQTEGDNR